MANLPDNDRENQRQFLELLSKFDPDLFLIKQALIETKINPEIIRQIIRTIGNLLIGSGFGVIRIHMQAKRVNNIVGEEKTMIEDETTIDI